MKLTAQMEPFDSFWEGPSNIEKGYASFGQFYRVNYLPYLPREKDKQVLVVSCGPGYFLNLLKKEGYVNVAGIDSDPEKVRIARKKGLNCNVEEAFSYLEARADAFDAIFCEQELNHLTKSEILAFLQRCKASLREGGTLIVHGLNGANPITGAEALAQNFDHYNTFTEYTLRQVLGHVGFREISVIPLKLYVFYKNPMNYVAMLAAGLLTLFFRFSFLLYGKSNRIFTKKIAAVCHK